MHELAQEAYNIGDIQAIHSQIDKLPKKMTISLGICKERRKANRQTKILRCGYRLNNMVNRKGTLGGIQVIIINKKRDET